MIYTQPHCTEIFSVYLVKDSKRAHVEENSSDCKRGLIDIEQYEHTQYNTFSEGIPHIICGKSKI